MKRILLLLILCSSLLQAAESPLFRCESEGNRSTASFSLLPDGTGEMEIETPGGRTACQLRVTSFENLIQSPSPSFAFVFERGICTPQLSRTQQKLVLDEITLYLLVRDPRKPRGIVQWLRREQTKSCAVGHFSRQDLGAAAARWELGVWAPRR